MSKPYLRPLVTTRQKQRPSLLGKLTNNSFSYRKILSNAYQITSLPQISGHRLS